MTKYLYGAAVQGIQSFIFQTNKLKDIIGASDLIEQVCKTQFARAITGRDDLTYDKACQCLVEDSNAILFAAGNIKYEFQDKASCEKVVRTFPKTVMRYAPGITISQAVVQLEDGMSFGDKVDELEARLRTQRNRQERNMTLGLVGVSRSRETGLPVVHCQVKGEHLDASTIAKRYHCDNPQEVGISLCQRAFGENKIGSAHLIFDNTDITKHNDWIAIIHADGNGLGQVVRKVGKDKDKFRRFSIELDKATTEAAVDAYRAVLQNFDEDVKIPIRPIVLGGDDLTIICRGDFAVEYAHEFIEQFEKRTKEHLGSILSDNGNNVFEKGDSDHLTACAGIAFIKSSYPFYYGYELAEALCSEAKKDAKKDDDVRAGKALSGSCLMFHKVQDSFVIDYEDIEQRELRPNDKTSLKAGPYYVNASEHKKSVDLLLEMVRALEGEEGNALKSGIRRWLSDLHVDDEMASQRLKRLKEITTSRTQSGALETLTGGNSNDVKTVMAYDVLALHTVKYQNTKSRD